MNVFVKTDVFDKPNCMGTAVYIVLDNGERVDISKLVSGVSFRHDAGDLPKLQLEVVGVTYDALCQLGASDVVDKLQPPPVPPGTGR